MHLLPLASLLAVAGVTYLSIFSPVIFADDWVFLRKFIFGEMQLANWASRRPLEDVGFDLLLNLVGLNLKALFLAHVLILFLCAAAVYFLILRLFPQRVPLALLSGVVFLVYPVDTSRMWFTQVYTWMIYLATLGVLYCLLAYAARGRWWMILAALGLFLFPLGAYEAQLGLVLAGSVLTAALYPGIRLRRRLVLLLPLLIGGLFVLWRVVLQPDVLGVHDPYMESVQFSPLVWVRRLGAALPVFAECWIKPFSTFLPSVSSLKLLFILSVTLASAALLAALVQVNSDSPENRLSWVQKWRELPGWLFPIGAGLVLLFAGYIPVVVYYGPNLYLIGASTRTNLFAILGGSLALVALLSLAAHLLAKYRSQVPAMVGAMVTLLVLIGVGQQIWNQNEARIAWRREQVFWQLLFYTLPDLKDGSTVVVVEHSPRPTRPYERLPINVEWEVNNGIKILYNNPSLQSTVFQAEFSDNGSRETRIKPEGVSGYDLALVPYSQVIFVQYTPRIDEVRVILDPEKELDLGFSIKGYDPTNLILPDSLHKTPYRYLVH